MTSEAAQQSKMTEAEQLKQEILVLARSYQGQGDPGFSKQNRLSGLVTKLLRLSPQPPVKGRLGSLCATWRQVWVPYDYRNGDRGVDPELGTKEIYQVVSERGYYYNASYLYKRGDPQQERIGLLRGEYPLDAQERDILRVRFTSYPGASERVPGKELWELHALAESGGLPNRISIVPTWIVRLFFGGGALREVYTDRDMRITYGSSGKGAMESIYVMERVK